MLAARVEEGRRSVHYDGLQGEPGENVRSRAPGQIESARERHVPVDVSRWDRDATALLGDQLDTLLPGFITDGLGVTFYFGGTSLLIIVVVTMDFMAQVQAHMMSHQYEGLLKKANLKGYSRSGTPR